MTYRMRVALAGALATVLLAPVSAVASASSSSSDSGGPYTWTVEKGHALACAGEENGLGVRIDLYENSTFGTHAQVIVQTADTEYSRGGETDSKLFNRGKISRHLVVEQQEETAGNAERVVINGSYAPSGPRQRVHDIYEEPFGTVVAKGWKTPLSADVTVRVLGQQVDLTCDHAFAFDLKVRRPVLDES